jgi:SAM-dependent methyltransferase
VVCPGCRGALDKAEDNLKCFSCDKLYSITPILNFLPHIDNFHNDILDNLKTIFKKFPRFYQMLSEIVSPVYVNKNNLKNIIKKIDKHKLMGLNIGSGVTNYSPNVINFELQEFANVEVVGNLFQLPFKDNQFDFVFSIYVLEHIANPEGAISEMYRVLKPGGVCYSLIPFIQGFHAAPADYIRLTSSGVESYFFNFEIMTNRGIGPTSALLWIFQEWVSILFSFGNERIKHFLHILIMCITFPIKYLDLVLSKNPLGRTIAVVNEVIARKPL